MKLRCKHFGHKWEKEVIVFLNPDPHPYYIAGTIAHVVEKTCARCGEVWRAKDYDHWRERGFVDNESYRFHDNPEDVANHSRVCRMERCRCRQ